MPSELISYISDAFAANVSSGTIKAELLAKGWQEMTVNQAIAQVSLDRHRSEHKLEEVTTLQARTKRSYRPLLAFCALLALGTAGYFTYAYITSPNLSRMGTAVPENWQTFTSQQATIPFSVRYPSDWTAEELPSKEFPSSKDPGTVLSSYDKKNVITIIDLANSNNTSTFYQTALYGEKTSSLGIKILDHRTIRICDERN